MCTQVATLHQGISGIHNGTSELTRFVLLRRYLERLLVITVVNPYINWPFVPEIVDFMEDFTSQAHAVKMQVKFYYTIRELTNHAVELFALKALQGEVDSFCLLFPHVPAGFLLWPNSLKTFIS